MSDKKIFLAGDHNHPGDVWAIDDDHWDWWIINGCAPFVLSKEEAQILLTEGGMGVDFGDGDGRWHYYPYEPLGEAALKELETNWEKQYEYWNNVRLRLYEAQREKGW